MNWNIEYIKEAEKAFNRLDGSQKKLVLKAIQKVSINPVSIFDGGFGKPLGNKNGNDLSGFMKIKLRDSGLRIVYCLDCDINKVMRIVVISVRADNEVYDITAKRKDNL